MTTLERANTLVDELRQCHLLVRDRRESDTATSLLARIRVIEILSALIQDHADATHTIMLQAARIAALESDLATLQAQVVAALSSAGPEVGEDERAP